MQRVLSALVLIPALVALIWWAPDRLFDAVIVGVIVLAAMELHHLVRNWAAWFALLILLVFVPLTLIGMIRSMHGPGALMILVGVVIASDSGQYYTGRAFGRRKLAPVISPKKTVEGAVGGVVVATVAAVALGAVWLPVVPALQMAGAGVAMAVAGIAGDLFESSLKRRAGVKDSGQLIPGHGGILDRIDSWLFAGPVFWLFLQAVA